jgi:dihydroxy-acid dehydratase
MAFPPRAEISHYAASETPPHYQRGFGLSHARHIKQADEGCDFDFLETAGLPAIPEPEIH